MKNKILTYLFLLLIFSVTLLDTLSPAKDFSENENRKLSLFPEVTAERIFSGDFGRDYETYVTDQFVARDTLINLKFLSDRALLKTESGGVYITEDALFVKQSDKNQEVIEKNILAMESFSSKYPASFILVPSATYVSKDLLPPFAKTENESALIESFSFESIKLIDVLDKMNSSDYFRTDHHWNADGALKAYNAYRETLDKEPLTRDDFVVSVASDSFLGTSTSKSGAVGITPDTLEKWERGEVKEVSVYNGKENVSYPSLWFDSFLDKKDKYAYFLGQNQPIVNITTGSEGGKILIFKDSYAHIFSQLLIGDYSQIVLVDLRYVSERAETLLPRVTGLSPHDFNEVLFLYSYDTFVTEYNMLFIK